MKVSMIMRGQSGVPGAAGVPGGQIGMFQLARALSRLDVEVELFVGGPRTPYLSGADDLTATYMRWPLRLDKLIKASPAQIRRFGTKLRRHCWLKAVAALPELDSADVIHVQGLEDAEALLTRLGGPLVVTHWGRAGRWLPQGAGVSADQSLPRRIERLRASTMLVAIGDAQAEALAAVGLPAVDVIPPGIDLQHFTPGDRKVARRQLGLPDDDNIVLYVGRLSVDKNVATLLKSFAQLAPRARRPQLLIVGDGPLRTALQRLSGELGIDSSTTFLPFVPHDGLNTYYRASDVVVVPSDSLETFCMVALEAIACRCPLIVTDQVPEILQRFPAVPSVPPYDIEALRDQIDKALSGDAKPAINAAIADYGWSAVARRYIALYQTAMRRPHNRGVDPRCESESV